MIPFDRLEPDPLPFNPGEPPAGGWAETGLPPCGFVFMGARMTVGGWLMPCPICSQGWLPLVPDAADLDGYRLATECGCSRGCTDPGELMRMHLVRLGQIPAPEPAEADEAARRYVASASSNGGRRIIEAADPARQLAREAYKLAQLAHDRGVEPERVARVLAVAARHAGIPAEAASITITKHMLAGGCRLSGEIRP